MSAFTPRILKNASRQLRKLDPSIAKRVVERIAWMAQHFDKIKPEALQGNLAGLFKYREGDYRIIYEPLHKEKVIVIHEIGHRGQSTRRPNPEAAYLRLLVFGPAIIDF